MRRGWLLSLVGGLSLALAQPAIAADRWRVEADVLVFDTEDSGGRISWDDVDLLRENLRNAPEVTTLRLSSLGGSPSAALEMSAIILDYGLATEIDRNCYSACTLLFLGGAPRTMRRGGLVGFHQTAWSPENIQSYYERNQEDEGWADPFDFASWVYEDTQVEIHEELSYMISRGVSGEFAVATLQARSDAFWEPTRQVLLEGGFLTE